MAILGRDRLKLLTSLGLVLMSVGAVGTLVSRSSSVAVHEITSDQAFNVPNKWIKEQVLNVSVTSATTDSEVAITRGLAPVFKKSGCLNPRDLICMNVRQIRLGDEVLFSVTTSIKYIDTNRNRTQMISTTNLLVRDTNNVTLRIKDGHWRKLLVNGQLIQTARYPFYLGVSSRETKISVGASDGSSLGQSKINARLVTSHEGKNWHLTFFVGFFITSLMMLTFIARRNRLSNGLILQESIFQPIIVLSGLVTGLTYILSSLGFFGSDGTYDKSGILYSRLVRFSDFYEVWDLHNIPNLYSSYNPDYPPAFVGLLRHTENLLLPEHVFLLVIGSALLTHVMLIDRLIGRSRLMNLVVATFFALSSAPLLFAIDRGGLDLLVYPLIVFGVIRHSQSRFKMANILFTLAAAIKVLPIVFVVGGWRKQNGVRKAATLALSFVALNLLGALSLPEKGITEFLFYFKKLIIRSGGEISDAVILYNNSAWSFVRTLQIGSSNLGFGPLEGLKLVWGISMILLLSFVIFWLRFRSETASARCVVLVSTMLLVVPLSGNYRLLYLYPAIWYLDKERVIKSHSLRNSLVIVGSLLLSICPIYYFGNSDINLGQLMKPILLTFMILIVCYSDDKRRKEDSVPIEIVSAL